MRRLCVFCFCLCLASCSSKYGDHPPYPTSGQILVDGQPAPKGLQVTFYHEGDWGEKTIGPPTALTDDQGKFELETYSNKDGAPVGDYKVTVEWPAWRRGRDRGPDKFGDKYAKKETSGLTAHVEKKKNQLPPFELTISPQQAARNKAVEAQAASKRARPGKRQ